MLSNVGLSLSAVLRTRAASHKLSSLSPWKSMLRLMILRVSGMTGLSAATRLVSDKLL
jgi:hypothetical protein